MYYSKNVFIHFNENMCVLLNNKELDLGWNMCESNRGHILTDWHIPLCVDYKPQNTTTSISTGHIGWGFPQTVVQKRENNFYPENSW